MSTRINKSYNAIVTMSDDTEIELSADVEYYDSDEMCMPDIDTLIRTTSPIQDGMVKEFKEEIRDAISQWFQEDACNSDEDDEFSFTFDTTIEELTRNGEYTEAETTQAVIERAIKKIQEEVADEDLTCIEGLLQVIPMKTIKDYLAED